MRLPRFILNPSVGAWLRLWQSERKQTSRLRRELAEIRAERDEWRDKLLQKVNVTPLFTPPPKPAVPEPRPPIGLTAKRAFIASQQGAGHIPSAEEILEQAARANGNS